ncbi:hypothetical protein FQA39_LY15649 [Lamprigera yunnana]|nr:hypothetical protein FQA39_LY15649 [Lamprigera yunnana]
MNISKNPILALPGRQMFVSWFIRSCNECDKDGAYESMMSPITAATEDPSTGNGGAGPEPRFVLSPPDSPRPTDANKSQCSSLSDGENYECYGEGADIDLDSGISTDRSPGDGLQTSPLNNGIKRHTWLRTSLRRSSPSNNQENLPNRRWGSFRHSGKRQLGSNALASQLYRSSSFNSSGRSSTCDTADDMYSDVSLEEDVLDLNHKFQVLQQQVGYLQDSANHNDDRYTRAKADNAALQARVIMLEEQLRDAELRYEDRLQASFNLIRCHKTLFLQLIVKKVIYLLTSLRERNFMNIAFGKCCHRIKSRK